MVKIRNFCCFDQFTERKYFCWIIFVKCLYGLNKEGWFSGGGCWTTSNCVLTFDPRAHSRGFHSLFVVSHLETARERWRKVETDEGRLYHSRQLKYLRKLSSHWLDPASSPRLSVETTLTTQLSVCAGPCTVSHCLPLLWQRTEKNINRILQNPGTDRVEWNKIDRTDKGERKHLWIHIWKRRRIGILHRATKATSPQSNQTWKQVWGGGEEEDRKLIVNILGHTEGREKKKGWSGLGLRSFAGNNINFQKLIGLSPVALDFFFNGIPPGTPEFGSRIQIVTVVVRTAAGAGRRRPMRDGIR